jgi:hypothetical protein
MRIHILPLLLILTLSACNSTRDEYIYTSEKVTGKREVAFVGRRQPWVSEIEKRLRQKGIRVKRFATIKEVTKKVDDSQSETYNQATTRVVMQIEGYAPLDFMHRCVGGGFKFAGINVELIDVKNNETLATYSNSGYSENCPPLSGTIFGDITKLVVSVFE